MNIPHLLRPLAEQLSLFHSPDASPRTDAPRASHGVVQLGAQIVPYELRRRARARLTLVITERGLRINAGQDSGRLLRDLLEELAAFGRTAQLEEKIEALLIRIACHGSVRGTWHLSAEEIRQLLRRMDSTEFAASIARTAARISNRPAPASPPNRRMRARARRDAK